MRRLRAGLIGSISAWLPSRRSTAHHSGATSMTLSGQVRSVSATGSTSAAKLRYRLTDIADARWVFQAGWSSRRGPAGVVMVRTEWKASGVKFSVMMWAPGWIGESQTGASRIPATGGQSGSDPRRGVREGAPAARR
ncbi:MAG: hypothetical protein PGN37_00240 [Mycobacterium kyogaense]